MRKIIGVVGVPGTGKSTLTRAWMKQYTKDWKIVEARKLVTCEFSKSKNMYVLGTYMEGEKFPGTDRLSLAVMPEAKKFLQDNPDVNVYFEGDRLGAQSFFEFIVDLPDTELSILLLDADARTLSIRYAERGSNQNETFLAGRETKVNGIGSSFILMDYLERMPHETPEDTETLVQWINERFM